MQTTGIVHLPEMTLDVDTMEALLLVIGLVMTLAGDIKSFWNKREHDDCYGH